MTKEELKDGDIYLRTPSTNSAYSVNEYGTVINSTTGKVIAQFCNKKGYIQISVTLSGKETTRKVHRLVAECFVENPNGYNCVDHIDGNKRNNHKSNLRWCTIRQNNEFYKSSGGMYGSSLSEEEVLDIFINYNNPNQTRIAAHKYNIDPDTVRLIKGGISFTNITRKVKDIISRDVIRNFKADPAEWGKP